MRFCSHKLAWGELLLFEEHKLAEQFDLSSCLLAVRCDPCTSLELSGVNVTEDASCADGVPPLRQFGKADALN